MKIGFFGTPELSAVVLADCLRADDVEVCYVVSQPDRPVGRHATVTPSPVSQLAIDSGLPLFRPERVRGNVEFLTSLQAYEVDFLVVVAYGNILPVDILELPRLLPINIHGSILPAYRGASPIQSSLLAGDVQTGVTIMEMTAGMDEGGILEITTIDIASDETSDTLFGKFCEISGPALLSALRKYLAGEISVIEQNHELATYTKKLDREDGRIRWSETSATAAYHRWQACTSWPGAWTMLDGKRCKIVTCRLSSQEVGSQVPGEFWKHGDALLVATCDGVIELGDIVIEGKPKRRASDILSFGSFDR